MALRERSIIVRNGRRKGKARTFGQRIEDRSALVRGMVIGAALAG
jgi:hypothetical protein